MRHNARPGTKDRQDRGGRFRRGSGTAIGFTFALAASLIVFLLCLSIVQLSLGKNQMEQAGSVIVRDLVVCTSLAEARETAEREAQEFFKDYGNITDVSTDVALASGSEDEWRRGDYVILYINAHVNGLTLPTSVRTTRSVAMVEHS